VELVRLTVVPNEIEAEQLCSLLGLEGIESMQRVTNLSAAFADGVPGMTGTREILVTQEDLKKARAIIGEG
jgi:hypothetical protein